MVKQVKVEMLAALCEVQTVFGITGLCHFKTSLFQYQRDNDASIVMVLTIEDTAFGGHRNFLDLEIRSTTAASFPLSTLSAAHTCGSMLMVGT